MIVIKQYDDFKDKELVYLLNLSEKYKIYVIKDIINVIYHLTEEKYDDAKDKIDRYNKLNADVIEILNDINKNVMNREFLINIFNEKVEIQNLNETFKHFITDLENKFNFTANKYKYHPKEIFFIEQDIVLHKLKELLKDLN